MQPCPLFTGFFEATCIHSSSQCFAMQSLLTSAEHRAEELKRSLRNFDAGRGGGRFCTVLQQFEQFSKQLVLLQDRTTDRNSQELLERHFAVPSSVRSFETATAPGMSTAAVPALLSTMLDKEQEEQVPPPALLARDEASDLETIARHNRIVGAAHEHLARIALRADLPGASSTFGASDGKRFGGNDGKRQRTGE